MAGHRGAGSLGGRAAALAGAARVTANDIDVYAAAAIALNTAANRVPVESSGRRPVYRGNRLASPAQRGGQPADGIVAGAATP